MSRSGYSDEIEQWDLIRWRGAVKSAIRGKRGQAFLKEMLAALDALPEKRLIRELLQDRDGAVCALGAVGRGRGLDMQGVDEEDHERVARFFKIPHALACEVMWINDDEWFRVTPEERFAKVREWIESQIAVTSGNAQPSTDQTTK